MKTLDDLLAEGVAGRRVLVRSDLNVPLGQSSGSPAVIFDEGRIRASVPTGSATDLTATLSRSTDAAEVNAAFKAAAEGPLKGYLRYTADPIVSSDIVTDPASCIFDSGLTYVNGNMAKVVGWYDNEWGYSCRLADLITYVGKTL